MRSRAAAEGRDLDLPVFGFTSRARPTLRRVPDASVASRATSCGWEPLGTAYSRTCSWLSGSRALAAVTAAIAATRTMHATSDAASAGRHLCGVGEDEAPDDLDAGDEEARKTRPARSERWKAGRNVASTTMRPATRP